MKVHLYMIGSRFEALIASHLEAEEFGVYMAVGTKKLASGRVIFFEIDPGLTADHFKIDHLEERCAPHADGSPKRSKYISTYRVLEFLPLSSFRKLYLTTPDGRVLALDPAPYDATAEQPGPAMYQELCPLIPLVVSRLPPAKFCRFMTDPKNPVSAPRLFFADLKIDRDQRGRLKGDLPYTDRLHIEECLRELDAEGGKNTKTVSRTPRTQGFFRVLRRGFFLGDQDGLLFYRFPSEDDLEIQHRSWWHSADR
jgi:hypothetical protein